MLLSEIELEKNMLKRLYIALCSIAIMFIIVIYSSTSHAVAVSPATQGNNSKDTSWQIPITVKEASGVGIEKYPVSIVVPLYKGVCQNTDGFRVIDRNGIQITAQFKTLTRWWSSDNSIRLMEVLFLASVDPFKGGDTGKTTYKLEYFNQGGGGGPNANNFGTDYSAVENSSLKVQEDSEMITVSTGPIQFEVSKKHFSILDQVWIDRNRDGVFSIDECIVEKNSENGAVLLTKDALSEIFDSERTDVKVTVEESGPVRTVILAKATTKYNNASPNKNHIHGFAVRIYAYEGQSFVKVDYQIQNSAKNLVNDEKNKIYPYSAPYYFDKLNLQFQLSNDITAGNNSRGGNSAIIRIGKDNGAIFSGTNRSGFLLAQEMHNKFSIFEQNSGQVLQSGTASGGFLDIAMPAQRKGVMAFIRHFWQTCANGISIDNNGKLSLELFPEWSAQWYEQRISPTGLYWLDDMQHVMKETFLWFHNGSVSDTELIRMSKTFEYHPVATIPVSWYAETKSAFDMDGVIPITNESVQDNYRIPQYTKNNYDTANINYCFNMDNFQLIEQNRKWSAGMGGDWPSTTHRFIASGNPADFFNAENWSIGELNVRPQWIAGYTHANDYKILELSANPYAGNSWRKFRGNSKPYLDIPYIAGTGQDSKPRDDEHSWFYFMEQAYNLTANPWIKDWYEFAGQFRRVKLLELDPWPDRSSRAEAHTMHNALEAYKITGDKELLELIQQHIARHMRPAQVALRHGGRGKDASFQMAFLADTVINFMQEIKDSDSQAWAEAFMFLSGIIEWNYNYSNFGNYIDPGAGEIGTPTGSGTTMIDPQAWYCYNIGRQRFMDHINQFLASGKAYKELFQKVWTGNFFGRYYQFAVSNPKTDIIPPNAVNDLTALSQAEDGVKLEWTTPQDAARILVLYANKPIAVKQTLDSGVVNWWAASVIASSQVANAGLKSNQIIPLTLPETDCKKLYVRIIFFDQYSNMSELSNEVEINITTDIERSTDTMPQTLSGLIRKTLLFLKKIENHIVAIWNFIQNDEIPKKLATIEP